MHKKLSKRLTACLNALTPATKIADIGTDHAYLPCHGIEQGLLKSAIAIDVIDGPLKQAKQTLKDFGYEDKIELRKGSGLTPLEIGEVEAVNIAGMGGKLISQLIEESLPVAKSVKRLVFQPQGTESVLRSTLSKNGFKITNEELVEEEGIIYTIISATPHQAVELSHNEIVFGPFYKENLSNELFIKKWTNEINNISDIMSRIPVGNERLQSFEAKQKLIKDVLADVAD
jgi:tRNA (adenine22-N1)-methyltransferase